MASDLDEDEPPGGTADDEDLLADGDGDDVADRPNEAADPPHLVAAKVPEDVFARYEIHSYRGAAVVLAESRAEEFVDLMEALRAFSLTTTMIRTAGGNESEIPKRFTRTLRPRGWHETTIQGDLLVRLAWKEQVGERPGGKLVNERRSREFRRSRYLDGHKIDFVKGRVAFDLEWNSKDQTFDRDLYAFNAFSQCGVIDVGVLLTRSASLNPVFARLGPALDKDGNVERDRKGRERPTRQKFGASTTWMGKLLYRLNAGRNGGCPVLAVGITPACIEDLDDGTAN